MDIGIFTCNPKCSLRKMKVRRVEVEESAKIDEFLAKYMYPDEPLACSLNQKEIPTAGEGFATKFAPQGLSRLAEDEHGNIIGVCMNDKIPQTLNNIYAFTDSDKKFQDVFDYMQDASHVMNLAPDAMELRILAVHPEFRNCGVASRLVDESITAAHEAGYSWVKMYCTSYYSSKMLSKKGWTLLYSKNYSDLKEKVASDLSVPNPPHVSLDLFIKATQD